MMIQQSAILFVAGQMLAVSIGMSQQTATNSNSHAARISTLSQQLRWQRKEEMSQYNAVRDSATQDLLKEIDGYIADSFSSGSTADQVKAGLDSVLGRKDGDDMYNIVFSTELPTGHFLVVGIELWRGGPAISENAISFRAYQASAGKFIPIASTANLADSALGDLNAKIIPEGSVLGQFWFVAWADVPPLAPYKVAVRLYGFDGTNFHIMWAPENIIADNIPNAVDVTNGGSVIVNRMPDWKSQIIEHDQYSVTAQGVLKTAEWATQRQ